MPRNQEEHLQEWYALFLHSLRNVRYCASLGGRRCSMNMARRMKRAGYVPGYPDMVIEEPRGKWHGMRVELKVGSYPSTEQKLWRDDLLARGYYAVIVPGNLEYHEAQQWLEIETMRYLRGEVS